MADITTLPETITAPPIGVAARTVERLRHVRLKPDFVLIGLAALFAAL